MSKFIEKLKGSNHKNQSLLCVGLDPDLNKLPSHFEKTPESLYKFGIEIIEATKDLVCAYKPNIAFFEACGSEGVAALEKLLKEIPNDIPVVLDCKRGDIGNTCSMYAKSCFEHMNVDAVTLSPYLGWDSIEPFAQYAGKGIFILVKTSNESSGEFQNLELKSEKPLYVKVAERVNAWQEKSKADLGVVVGATYPEELKTVREIIESKAILLPGLGAQGGDAESCVKFGTANDGMLLINSSRSILYASNGTDFASASREKAKEMRDKINSFLG